MSTPDYDALLALGDRYAALGLVAAARGVLGRASACAPEGDARAVRRLAELAIAAGQGDEARGFAEEVVARERGPGSRVLFGRAQIEAGALDAARLSFSAAIESAGAARDVRARAYLGHARVAAMRGDTSGSGANAMAAIDELLTLASERDDFDDVLPLAEDAIKRAVACDRASDLELTLREFTAAKPGCGATHVLRAVALAARQSRGEADIRDGDVEAELSRGLALRESSLATRLYLAERKLRRRFRDPGVRAEAIGELEALRTRIGEPAPDTAEGAALARVLLMLAEAYEEEPGAGERAEATYREALALRPSNATAAGRLALMALSHGDFDAALSEVERCLRIDGEARGGWRNAARAVSTVHGVDAEDAVARVLESACPGADRAPSSAAARLLSAGSEIEREAVLAGVHARGHRMKNLLGIVGARVRSTRKRAADTPLADRLADLESEVTTLYDEWAAYLRSMQSPPAAVIELVPVAPFIMEVIGAARERTPVMIAAQVDDGLPDLRGDRLLLVEALLNVINNAAEACGDRGRVDVSARVARSGAAPVVEIEVADTGPGIARADLARVFSPGFTTKESGSGVGLVIAERVVASHHGRILIDSERGRGTRVSLMLPSDLGGFAGLASFPLPGGGE